MKRALSVVAATAITLVALAVVSKPAGATEQPRITVKPNTTVEVTHPGPLGGGNAYFGSVVDPTFDTSPESCATGTAAAYCDTIPLTLDVPDITKGFYSLSFTLEWNTTNLVIPGMATTPTSQLGLGVWDDPIVKDDDAPASCSPDLPDPDYEECLVLGPSGGDPGGDEAYTNTWLQTEEPIRFGMIPKRTKYSVVVANYYGQIPTYTLKVSLIFVGTGSLKDLSIELPPDLSGLTGPTAAAPSESARAAAAPAAPDLSAFGLADLGPQTELSGLKINGDDSLDLNPADLLHRRVVSIRRPGHESPFWLWFWLVVLPLSTAGGTMTWFIRRRAALIA